MIIRYFGQGGQGTGQGFGQGKTRVFIGLGRVGRGLACAYARVRNVIRDVTTQYYFISCNGNTPAHPAHPAHALFHAGFMWAGVQAYPAHPAHACFLSSYLLKIKND